WPHRPRRPRRTAAGPRPRWRRSSRAAGWYWRTPGSHGPPLGLERGHVDDDAAARVGALAQAYRQHAARDAEILHRASQGKGIGRDDADIRLDVDKAFRIEGLGVDD